MIAASMRRFAALVTVACWCQLAPCDVWSPIGQSEHSQATGQSVELDPTYYWYLEAMGKLENLRTLDGTVEGSYAERLRITHFTIDEEKLQDPKARTEGYKKAVKKIIGYMAPGAVVDSEANRDYLTKLKSTLSRLTALSLSDYEAWRAWWESNESELRWSEGRQMLIVGQESKD
jgi:hypothetical protein